MSTAKLEDAEDIHPGVCNGPLKVQVTGTFAPGGMQLVEELYVRVLTDTSQPYNPSLTDPQRSMPGDNLTILEVPDNGVMIDYLSLAEMNSIFDANFDGTPLPAPKTLMMGFHPAMQFSQDEHSRVDGFLKYADQHLAAKGTGPVVYISLSEVTEAGFSAR